MAPTIRQSAQSGSTLAEMLLVVAILAIIAAIAMPSIAPAEQHKVALAGSEVADALRFAREEARRTGTMHGVSIEIATQRLRVFRLDETQNPNAMVFDVRHPLSKQPYTLQFDVAPLAGVKVGAVLGTMVGTCTTPGPLAIDPFGVTRCIEPVATRIEGATINVSVSTLFRTVAIDRISGRVTVQ